ncbi:hypothetical protein J6590_003563 [Homalodisca vitripennis]|nr:hypothetical protein J6590_003563 [Homalodisca vitripennis]
MLYSERMRSETQGETFILNLEQHTKVTGLRLFGRGMKNERDHARKDFEDFENFLKAEHQDLKIDHWCL